MRTAPTARRSCRTSRRICRRSRPTARPTRSRWRDGLKYSDGSAIKASDFAATIERDFKVDSPGVGFFGNIVGADTFGKTKTGHISGITTDDKTGAITIKLNTPQGDFTNILATEFAALVPAGSPAKDQSTTPLPASGPYMIKSYAPNKKAIVVRNPNFDASVFGGNVPAGNPDMMTIDVIGDDTVALQRVIAGQDDYDFHQLPPDRLASTQQKYGDQIKVLHAGEHVLLLHEHPGGAVRQSEGAPGRELRDQP